MRKRRSSSRSRKRKERSRKRRSRKRRSRRKSKFKTKSPRTKKGQYYFTKKELQEIKERFNKEILDEEEKKIQWNFYIKPKKGPYLTKDGFVY